MHLPTEPEPGEAIRVYLHREGSEDPEVVEVPPGGVVSDLLATAMATTEQSAERIWLEDCDEPLDSDSSLADAGVVHRSHVNRSRCNSVKANVRYNGKTLEREFSPSSRMRRVLDWAAGSAGFEIPEGQRPKLRLWVRGAKDPLEDSVHIGSLVLESRCVVALELAEIVLPQG